MKIITTINENKNFLEITFSDTIEISKKPFQQKKIKGIGEKLAKVSSYFFEYINGFNIPTVFDKLNSENQYQVKKFIEVPFLIKMLNNVDKRTSKIFNIDEYENLSIPILEIYKDDNPFSLITESHILAFNLVSSLELRYIFRLCSKINAVLKNFFERRNLLLVEFNCHFGKVENQILLVGDFTPMSFKIIDKNNISLNPYKIKTPKEISLYTNLIFNLINT